MNEMITNRKAVASFLRRFKPGANALRLDHKSHLTQGSRSVNLGL